MSQNSIAQVGSIVEFVLGILHDLWLKYYSNNFEGKFRGVMIITMIILGPYNKGLMGAFGFLTSIILLKIWGGG